jgi:DNA repair protein RadC
MTTTRPEDKRLSGDAAHVSTLDLLAVLVSADAARALLSRYPTLTALDDASAEELSGIPEMDTGGVATLLAAREISRRRAAEVARRGAPVLDSRAVVDIVEPLLRTESREVVMVLALDTKRRLLCPPITVAVGTIDSVPVHARELFRPLIRVAASAAVLVHLHPSSGEPVPSPDDIMLTARLKEAGDLLGIPLLDHVVIGRGCSVSMSDRGLM